MPATTDTSTPAPGPELTLGGPSKLGTLSAESLAALTAVATKSSDKPSASAPSEPENKPAPKPAAKAEPMAATPPVKPDAKPAPTADDSKKGGVAQLREEYEKLKTRATELEASVGATTKEKAEAFTKLAEYEGKVKSYEERIQREFQPAIERLTEKEKKLQEAEERLRIRDYTETTEWHERYIKPIAETQGEVDMLLTELRATLPDGSGEVQATRDHFNYILAAPSINEAAKRAEQLFGQHVAPQVVNLRTRLTALERKRAEGLKTAQLESAEWQKRSQAQQVENTNRFKQAVQQRLQSQILTAAEGDAEEAAALAEGQKLAELVANGAPNMTPDDVANVVAQVQARTINEPVRALKLKRAEAKIAALEEELKAYRGSEPPIESRRGGSAPEVPEGQGRNTEERLKSSLLEAARAAARGR